MCTRFAVPLLHFAVVFKEGFNVARVFESESDVYPDHSNNWLYLGHWAGFD
tara:strand:- start:546 stop:698 length:153 start_codon:yes stop_codon:yes gene_type:complete